MRHLLHDQSRNNQMIIDGQDIIRDILPYRRMVIHLSK